MNEEQMRQALRDAGVDESLLTEVWDTATLQRDFDVKGFMAPFVVAVRRSDQKLGSLQFTHSPRIYFAWAED